jgi:hypothetical protein
MTVSTQLASGLAGAIGSDFRRSTNELIFVEYGGKLSSVKLGPAAIVSSGTVTLHGTYTFNLDTGIEGGSLTTDDLWWEQQTDVQRQMMPLGAAQLVNLGLVDFAALTALQLKDLTYGSAPIPANNDATNQLVNGTVFAVRTNSGHFAKVQVLTYGYDLHIQWVTYQFGPLYRVLGQGYQEPEDVILSSSNPAIAYITERSGNLLRVNLNRSGERASARVISTGMVAPHQLVLDEARNHAYVVEYANPGRLLRIDLRTGAQTVIAKHLEGAIGLLLTQDLQFAYISEQSLRGGRITRIDLNTLQRQVMVTGLTAPFFLTWVDASQKAIYLVERDPANRVSVLNLATLAVSPVATGVPFRPSSVAIAAPGRLLVCCDREIQELNLGFTDAGPLLLGIGFVPVDRIVMGKADTSGDPGYFFQVKDAPFGGSLPLMLNHKRAYDQGARRYQILVDGVVKTDAWSDYEWDAGTTRFELRTINPDASGFYPVRSPEQIWLNPWLSTLLNTVGLSNSLHTLQVLCVDAAGALVDSTSLAVLTNNNPCVAKLAVPVINNAPGVDPTVADPTCGTLKYFGDKTKTVVMPLTASHPQGYATYSFRLLKGVNTLTPPSMSGPVSAAPTAINDLVGNLLGACTVAGFAEYLTVATTITNGWGRQSQYDASAAIAFVLTPN